MPAKTIQTVLAEHTPGWMAVPGVVGTAIGQWEGRPCIEVFVERLMENLAARIPAQVEGYPVVVEETGLFRALR